MTGKPAVTALIGLCCTLAVGGCAKVSAPTSTHYKPAALATATTEAGARQVTLTEEAARRIGLQTEAIRAEGKLLVLPSAAVIYDPKGGALVYTATSALTFLRVPVQIVKADAQHVWASSGPKVGTQVVTTGASQVYGAEFEVGH
jgi:hypothetical protein